MNNAVADSFASLPERSRAVKSEDPVNTSFHGGDEWRPTPQGGAAQRHSDAVSRVVTGFTQAAVIDRFEGMHAVLKTEGGQEVRWPVKLLPDDATVGAAIRIMLSTAVSEEAERAVHARSMLNEILRVPQ